MEIVLYDIFPSLDILPSQSTHASHVLTTDGTVATWQAIPVPAAAGATTQVQFNNANVLTGSTAFTFTTASSTLAVSSLTTSTTVDLTGSVRGSIVSVGASNVDCATGNYFTRSSPGALTWTFSNPPASKSYIFVLRLTNGASGVQTWPASVKWPGSLAPTLTANVDLLIFSTENAGVSWHGAYLLNYSA